MRYAVSPGARRAIAAHVRSRMCHTRRCGAATARGGCKRRLKGVGDRSGPVDWRGRWRRILARGGGRAGRGRRSDQSRQDLRVELFGLPQEPARLGQERQRRRLPAPALYYRRGHELGHGFLSHLGRQCSAGKAGFSRRRAQAQGRAGTHRGRGARRSRRPADRTHCGSPPHRRQAEELRTRHARRPDRGRPRHGRPSRRRMLRAKPRPRRRRPPPPRWAGPIPRPPRRRRRRRRTPPPRRRLSRRRRPIRRRRQSCCRSPISRPFRPRRCPDRRLPRLRDSRRSSRPPPPRRLRPLRAARATA